MRKAFIFIIFCYTFSISGFCQDFQWVRQIKGIKSDYNDFANGLDVDSNENSYTIGNTESLIFDLDPTVLGTEIIDNTIINNSFRSTYLIKTDKDGNYVWGLTFALYKGNFNPNDTGYDVKIGTDGNVYILLTLNELNTSLNVIDSFIKIIKISPEGNIISTKTIKQNYGFNNTMYVYSFDLDNQNNIFLSGYFLGNITINDNPNLNLNTTGIGNYLLKINNSGDYDWVKQFDISDNSKSEVIVRPDGNINLLINKFDDYVLYNIDNMSNSIIWQKDFINQTQITFHVSNNGIVILGDKNYYDTIDVDPSSSVLNISGNKCFIIFLNLNGNLIDIKQFYKPTNGNITFTSVTTDNNGDYFFGGNFRETIDLDSSNNTFNLTSSGYIGETFYLKLDVNKNFESAIKLGDENPKLSAYNNCEFLKIKKIKIVNNNNYLMGDFKWTCDFDPSVSTQYTLGTINGATINSDGFILKLGPCNNNKIAGEINQFFCSASNPTISELNPNSSSINWYDSLTSTTPLTNTTLLIDAKNYYASRKIGDCPESPRLSITVKINQSPQKPIIYNQTFCESEKATISNLVIVGQNIKWYDDTVTASNELSETTLLQNNTNYLATQTVNGCESSRIDVNINVNLVEIPTFTSPQIFCIQQNTTLSDITISGQNIKWYDAATAGSTLTNTTALQDATNYYASQTINGCESARVPVLIVIQNTTAPTGNITQSFCSSQNATLNDIVVTGTDLKWYDLETNTTPLATSILLANGVTYYATQTVNSCESVAKLAVTISLITTLNATNYSHTICDDLNDNTENIDLTNYNTNLIGSTSNVTFTYYSSNSGAENQTAIDQVNSNYALSSSNKTIHVRIDSTNGCHQIVMLQLTLVSKPIIPITDIIPICEKKSISVNAGVGFNSYLWSTGENTKSIVIKEADNYFVTVTKNYGTFICSSTKNFTVALSNKATFTKIETQDWTDADNTITAYTSGKGNYEYSINGIDFQTSNQFSDLKNGEYTVYARDTNGCGTVSEEVYLLMYPKFFTPNGDGSNDTWKINFSINEPGINIKIFDRYGKSIKELSKNELGWDGTYGNQELPATDYWFVVTRANGKEYRGHFSLKR